MTSNDRDQALTAPRPQFSEESGPGDPPPPPPPSPPNQIHVHLVATRQGNRIDIDGPPGPFPLNVDSGAWLFKFTLADRTNAGVKFTTLDAADNCSTCPPAAGGTSHLIVGAHVDPTDPTKASFTDNNNNPAHDGVVDVSFQWHFECDDPSVTRIGTYDPIVPNGGKTVSR